MASKHKLGVALLGLLLINASIGCASPVRLSTGPIKIDRIGTCEEIDSTGQPIRETSLFSAGSEVVYVYFHLESPVSVPIEVKWFRDDESIGTAARRVEPGPNNTWLRSKEGEHLPPGNYSAEIWANETKMAEVKFVIQ